MLSLNNRYQLCLDFITSVDFLGTIYKTYEDLITADWPNWLGHLMNWDMILGKVRKGFKRLETFIVLDNYFRLISGLSPAPYTENQPSQSTLEQNSLEYLTSLATIEVNSILRALEQPEMYKDRSTLLPLLPQHTPPTTGTQVDQPLGIRPIVKTPPASQTPGYNQVSHPQPMNILGTQSSTWQAILWPAPISIVDLGMLTGNTNQTTHQVQPSGMPVSFVSTTQVRSDILAHPTVNTVVPLLLQAGYPFANPKHCQHS